jgi:sugar phosphate isomerase/epimerase
MKPHDRTESPEIQSAISRRLLLTAAASAGAAAALGLGPGISPAAAGPTARVPGIQLYTLRGSMAEDPLSTLTAVAAMGFGAVEFAGYHGRDPATLKSWLDELGLSAPAAHVNPHELRDDPQRLIDDAVVMGHRYLVVAWLDEKDRRTADQYRGWAEVLNRAGEMARDAGVRMAYHNHDFEFVPVDGEVPQRVLMAETDPALVDFELDFFWVRKAGLDIAEVLAWAPERFRLAHLKDIDEEGNMVDVGTGTIDFAGLLSSELGAAIDHPFVEHDNSPDPFRTAAIGRWNLSRALAV